MGLIPPDKGRIIIDGQSLDIKNNYHNLNHWQSIITHVPQSIFLIDGIQNKTQSISFSKLFK